MDGPPEARGDLCNSRPEYIFPLGEREREGETVSRYSSPHERARTGRHGPSYMEIQCVWNIMKNFFKIY